LPIFAATDEISAEEVESGAISPKRDNVGARESRSIIAGKLQDMERQKFSVFCGNRRRRQVSLAARKPYERKTLYEKGSPAGDRPAIKRNMSESYQQAGSNQSTS